MGESRIVLTGGAENMSLVPFLVRNVRYGTVLGKEYELEDYLWTGFYDSYCDLRIGMTAEKLGAKYNLKREEVDRFALASHQRWKAGKGQ